MPDRTAAEPADEKAAWDAPKLNRLDAAAAEDGSLLDWLFISS